MGSCQSCACPDLEPRLQLGSQPLCNDYRPIGAPSEPVTTYPLDLLQCPRCELVQLAYVPPADVVFPVDYPYRSGTTKLLRDNFADLARDVRGTIALDPSDLVVDIGSNDGTLLANFLPCTRVLGITPESAGDEASARGMRTWRSYFTSKVAASACAELGPARAVTACNVFAHVPDINDFLEGVRTLLAAGGIFVTESTYLHDTLDTLAYDTIYSEHARYLTLGSIAHQLAAHGFDVFRVQHIATHGGSIRVWACRKGERPIETSVATLAFWEHHRPINAERFQRFARDIAVQRERLWSALAGLRDGGIHGVGAPSRASTLIHYVGLDHHVMPVVYETAGSGKLGRFMPGTRIEVREEPAVFGDDQPGALLLLSWHLAGELTAKLRAKGFRGVFVVPLAEARVI